ncbi:MAG: 3-deoxy-7-phosphoheptulonate synthase [Oscillospiraceae bacterium]|nr:3-deoxy-7-phosphoheptulonate synthase [Oscillospiraceae bacterium]
MIFILKRGVSQEQLDKFVAGWEKQGLSAFVRPGTEHTAVCLIGNTAHVDMERVVELEPIVDYARRVTEPYKLVSRTVQQENTIIRIGGAEYSPSSFPVISGPCSVESEEQVVLIAKRIKAAGARLLRGGAFKPRTSPYSFQGLGEEGLRFLLTAKQETGLPVVTEIMNQTQIPLFEDVDVVQIGARNMQNFDLLKAVGRMGKTVLLKRGLANTIEELLMSAEYLMSEGCENIILCERGIRTFETMTRNTLDLSAVVLLKQKCHLPVIVDPSHAAGIRSLVPPLSKAALAVGADGLMVETHNDPAKALCDGAQSLDLDMFDKLMDDLKTRAPLEGRTI